MKFLTLFAALLLSTTTVQAAGTDDILGIWKTELDESKVEVYRCGEKICGKIVWLKRPVYTDGSDGQDQQWETDGTAAHHGPPGAGASLSKSTTRRRAAKTNIGPP